MPSPLYLPLDGNSQPKFLGGYYYKETMYGVPTGTYTNIFRWKYSTGLVIEVFHLGGTSEGKLEKNGRGTSTLGKFSGNTNLAGSSQIGYIGGLGGITPFIKPNERPVGNRRYVHSHIQFVLNGKKVDPRSFYCAGYSR
jgi:hypothetical protein